MIQLRDTGVRERTIWRLSQTEIRSIIEELKSHGVSGGSNSPSEFAVIIVDFEGGGPWRLDTTVAEIDFLDELLLAGWAHETHLGWLGDNRLAIVLPNASAIDGWQYKVKIQEHCNISAERILVFARDTERIAMGHDYPITIVPSIDELLVRRLPTWKRAFDVTGAMLGLFVASPLILIAAILIKATSRGPVFFKQPRVGVAGRPFLMYKLRTMVDDAEKIRDDLNDKNESDGCAFKLKQDPRVTLFGRLLRKSSLDEVPQLLNVLRGEMSLVGPRPLPCEDWHPVELWYRGRHDVPPGITCTWQVTGRGDSSVSFEEWVRMDIEYVESQSFWTDLKLLLRTIPAVITQRGAA